jgi:hypothetical protein
VKPRGPAARAGRLAYERLRLIARSS